VGATYPQELSDIRRLVGNLPILIPGIGAQGGDLEKAIMAGRNSRGNGMIINSSRGIIYASSGNDYAGAAQREALKLHKEIKRILGLSSVGT
ncbi:MAG: orotidine 5'-phosphate decarboxylase, partial [Candidatus Taylorbacteria bacterium]|nr:orotidine 5'-phosphate decarboxylase [Candidatus Taylorbacteria bacterium]